MAIVTGDRYLELLSRFVEEYAGSLLDGNLVLKLNPVGLHYVQNRLDALQELERLRTGAPVDYLRAYIADLGDHRALEQLRRVLSLLSSLKLVSVLQTPIRDPSTVTLSAFGRLRFLELRECDLSTTAARGLLELRPVLERLICHNSADALRHIFMERIVEIQDAQPWSRLQSISCASNKMLLMDESLQLLPVVQYLDLSRNNFAKVANLHHCLRLKFLDLGFNQLQNISSLNQIKSQLSMLVLRNNALVSTDGIAALTSLEELDLSYNLISKFMDIKPVARIGSLKTLLLEGNPLCVSSCYREEIFSLFPDPKLVCLDGSKITCTELWTVSSMQSMRRMEEEVYGLYVPAETSEAEAPVMESENAVKQSDDAASTFLRGKRKVSRLALIQDAQQHVEDVNEQDESLGLYNLPWDMKEKRSDSLDEAGHSKDEAFQLRRKIEALKEEGSKTWVQDLRALLEGNDEQTNLVHQKFDMQSNGKLLAEPKLNELRRRWSRRRRRYRQRSLEEDDMDSQARQGHYVSVQEHMFSPEGSGFSEKTHDHLPVDTKMTVKSQLTRVDSGFLSLEADASCNTDETMQQGFSYTADEEQTSMDESYSSWKLIDGRVEAHGAKNGSRSPPQYHEDVLQKRQKLEEELLHLSLDSGYAPASTDSETSSDGPLIAISSFQSSEDGDKDHLELCEGLELHDNKRIRNTERPDSSNAGDDKIADEQHEVTMHQGTKANSSKENSSAANSDTEMKITRKVRRARLVEISENAGNTEKNQVSIVEASSADNQITTFRNNVKLGSLEPINALEDTIMELFRYKFGNAEEGEVCLQYTKCGCLLLCEDSPLEREVYLLASSSNKLYVITDSRQNGSTVSGDVYLHLLASHEMRDVTKIVVGLGMQVLRVDINHSTSYVFVTRNVNASTEILDMLRKCHITDESTPDVQSWEHRQLRLFEESVLGGTTTNILMYLMPLFCCGETSDSIWVSRSVFLTSNHIFLCMENLVHFGIGSENTICQDQPYIAMEASANICDLSEVVADLANGWVTLNFEKICGNPILCDPHGIAPATTWKFKCILDQVASKLVALLRASHMEVTLHPLTVKDHTWNCL